jgi:glutamate/tyrosine decarboxylase-like PLP-dependent enzyme
VEENSFTSNLINFIQSIENWKKSFPAYSPDDLLKIDHEQFKAVSKIFLERLENNYPFHHPLYAGQMLKPPHDIAVLGYIAAMLINPNNHALDGGPASAEMEKEVIDIFADAFGYKTYLGHLTTSGTIANLEALFIAREEKPNQYILFSDQAHYTHERACNMLKVPYKKIPSDPLGRMDLNFLEQALQDEKAGTIVVTLGSTGLGALDNLEKIISLKAKYDFRIHIDSAYGGYYGILCDVLEDFKHFKYISQCESFAVDPHKLGMQPYGCGCIIYNNPAFAHHLNHDSPYTYFTSQDLHLGEISLECSRAGASAAALWLTLKMFDLHPERGFGPILKKTRQNALNFANLLNQSSHYHLYVNPDLDIVTYFPKAVDTYQISLLSDQIFDIAMNKKEKPLYLAKLKVSAEKFHTLFPEIKVNSDTVTILRSCMIKPEQDQWLSTILKLLEQHYNTALQAI